MDDHQLLDQYAREGSQGAFAELLARHLNLVYSAALRQVRDVQKAQDISQLVFANLARKAADIPRNVILAGWLHRDTRFTALDMLRRDGRRAAQSRRRSPCRTLDPDGSPEWEQLRPFLDEALDELAPAERDALLLRYFEQRSLKDIGVALGSGEEAARKRVSRGLDKLRDVLARRGVTASASALSVAMTTYAIEAAPAALTSSILSSALAAPVAAVGTIAASQAFRALLMTKLKTAAIGLALTAGITTAVVQTLSNHQLRAENLRLAAQKPRRPT